MIDEAPGPTTGTAAGGWRRIAAPYSALRLSGQAFEFVGWALLARRLGSSTFGSVAIVFLACRYAGIVADWGAAMRGPRDAAIHRGGTLRAYIRLRTSLAATLSGVAVAALILAGRPELTPMAAVTLSLGLSRDWIALGHQRGARAGAPLFMQGLALTVLAFTASGVEAASWAVAISYALAAVASILLNRVRESSSDGQLRLDAWMLTAVLATQVTSSMDTILLGALASTSSAGIYAAVYRIPNAWVAVLSAVLAGLLPVASHAARQEERHFRALKARSLRMSGIGALLVVGFTPLGVLAVPLLLGSDYTTGQLPAAILLVATAAITLAAPLHPLAVAATSDRSYATVLLTGAVVNTGLNLVMIPWLNMAGAATATLAAQCLIGVWLWFLIERSSDPQRR